MENKNDIKIVITDREMDYHVCIEGKPEYWSCGATQNAAIGNLIRTHQKVFGLIVEYGGKK